MNYEKRLNKVKASNNIKCGFINGDKTATLLITEPGMPITKIRLTLTGECSKINLHEVSREVVFNKTTISHIFGGDDITPALTAMNVIADCPMESDGSITLTSFMGALTQSNEILRSASLTNKL